MCSLVHLSVSGAILSVLYAFRLKNFISVHVELVPSSDTGTPFKGTAIAPEIIEPLQTTKVKDGKPVTLRCRIKGTPMPTVAWFRQSTQIPATEEFKIATDGDIATLTIEEVYPEDSGKYTCVAKNQAGTSSTSAELLVEGRCLLILSHLCLLYHDSFMIPSYIIVTSPLLFSTHSLYTSCLFLISLSQAWYNKPSISSVIAETTFKENCLCPYSILKFHFILFLSLKKINIWTT